MKKLFIFCDGTWQDSINNQSLPTNVTTLARCLQPKDANGNIQLVWYDSGIGNVTSTPAQFIDAATGRGISAKIRNAYSFLAHNYNFKEKIEKEKDEIILVGFSRGAFAVQCLASLISQTGLLEKKYLYYLRGLFTVWSHQEVKDGPSELKKQVERLKLADVLHNVRIRALAVWDTVSSLGFTSQSFLSFVGKQVPKHVDYAFQALALDERRRSFQPCVWESKESKDITTVSQCWFLGSHGDVGGNADVSLGALTLLWMIGKLGSVGVAFDENEIAKHLKHKYLEWEFRVSRTGSFEEIGILSTMSHSGQAHQAPWYWSLLGWKPRISYLVSTAPIDDHTAKMEIHFTVRLAILSGRSKCPTLQPWKATLLNNKVQWESEGNHSLSEHPLGENVKEDMEHNLISKWCRNEFEIVATDRPEFGKLQRKIQDPKSDQGLGELKFLLKDHLEFDGGILARTMVHSDLR